MLSSEEKRSRFEKALASDGGTHAVADVIDLVRAGKAQYWERGDGTVITEVQASPRRRVLNYWLVSGRLRDCLDLQAEIDAWGVAEGCTMAAACGLPKWEPILAREGWRPWHLANFWKPLTGEEQARG
jgi:hypothetical protein